MPELDGSPVKVLRKLMSAGVSFFRRGFNASKCKTEAKMAVARIKLLRNRREAQVRQMRRDIAQLLEARRDDTARIRVEHVIREQNVMAANEILDLFCELMVARLPIIAKQRECPSDLKEGISSLIYASPRCSEIPELTRICSLFEKKYGKDFVSAATDLRPESGVNRMLIEKLSVKKPTGEVKLKFLKEIAKEYHVSWDPTESEEELLKPPEEVLEGPRTFVSATNFPLKPHPPAHCHEPDQRSSTIRESTELQFNDPASAAQAAAESAKKAVSAAQAAAYLANQSTHPFDQDASIETFVNSDSNGPQRSQKHMLSSVQSLETPSVTEMKHPGKQFNSHSFNVSKYAEEDMENEDLDNAKVQRRNSCIARTMHSDIKFDDSDGFESETDGEDGMESPSLGRCRPPNRPAPKLPTQKSYTEEKSDFEVYPETFKVNAGSRVHPKLPNYEDLAARFDAMKSRKP